MLKTGRKEHRVYRGGRVAGLNSTFYFTERYLCAPSAYALIRYDKIKDIHANSVRVSKAGQQSVFVNIEFTYG